MSTDKSLEQLRSLVLHPGCSNETKCLALSLAYQLGKSDGRLELAEENLANVKKLLKPTLTDVDMCGVQS